MKQVNGLRYVAPLREGGSLPAIVETDEPGAYVVKFRGAGQGPKALIAELLAAELARPLGLLTPDAALVTLAAGFGQGEPDPEIQDLLRASVGRNFGLRYLPGALAYDPAAKHVLDPDLAAAIVWFDAYLTNVDRTPRNTNLLWWPTTRGQQPALYLIDHGAALYFQHRWEGWESRIQSAFPQIKDHVLLPFAGDLLAADARLRPLLTATVIQNAVAAIPDDWLGDEAPFADRDAHRAAYITYLLARLTGPRRWLQEAHNAAARTRLV
ncbi:MAG: HipA family kinase [Thermomicrobiales bacterium]